MAMSREQYAKKLTPHIAEVYDLHIKSLDIKQKETQKEADRLAREMVTAIKTKEELVYRIGRATDDDLVSFHYLFFGVEDKLIK